MATTLGKGIGTKVGSFALAEAPAPSTFARTIGHLGCICVVPGPHLDHGNFTGKEGVVDVRVLLKAVSAGIQDAVRAQLLEQSQPLLTMAGFVHLIVPTGPH